MRIGVRWTIGDVSSRGFDTLALSLTGARRIFGDDSALVVCVNTVPLEEARRRVGPAAALAEWRDCTAEIPQWIRPFLRINMAEGVAWKFAPPQIFNDRPILRLDNDVILWDLPDSMRRWLEDGDSLLIAEDVQACYGRFAPLCPPEPRNSGIVGLPAGCDFESSVRALLTRSSQPLESETDEQGLQVAIVTREKHRVIKRDLVL